MNQRHRVFIAINLAEDIRKKLTDYSKKWPELPIRWTKPYNLHITLAFLGYVTNDDIMPIIKKAREVASKHVCFDIRLKEVCYGPINKRPPHMIWVVGEKSGEFTSLKNDIDDSFIEFSQEKREFTPHITLGRINQWQWRRIEPEEVPEIGESINFNIEVNSIDVMESVLKRSGPDYAVLESIPLKL